MEAKYGMTVADWEKMPQSWKDEQQRLSEENLRELAEEFPQLQGQGEIPVLDKPQEGE